MKFLFLLSFMFPCSIFAQKYGETPVWAEEFNYSGAPDSSKWSYDLGGNGYGNNELQYYTNNRTNSIVKDGVLRITVKKEACKGNDYTSARLLSKKKGDWLYGRFEIKAKLPYGKGTWPAIWMLPTDGFYGGWPKSGEIDIMEHVGYDQNKIHITVHTEAYNHRKGTQVGKQKVLEDVSSQFHLYRVDWTPEFIKGFIDDELIFTFENEHKGSEVWPFDQRSFILLNVAYGGDWGGSQGIDDSVLPQTMEVDYVRVYKMID